jgi:hypothetical protein
MRRDKKKTSGNPAMKATSPMMKNAEKTSRESIFRIRKGISGKILLIQNTADIPTRRVLS